MEQDFARSLLFVYDRLGLQKTLGGNVVEVLNLCFNIPIHTSIIGNVIIYSVIICFIFINNLICST